MVRTIGRTGVLVSLSIREADIVRLVAANLRPVEIATELHLREKTVCDYIWRICQALGLGSRQDLMVWGMQNPNAVGPDRKPAYAGLHSHGCPCGSVPCSLFEGLRAA
jgi:DNA-binding CsgD family transcriptional regulator